MPPDQFTTMAHSIRLLTSMPNELRLPAIDSVILTPIEPHAGLRVDGVGSRTKAVVTWYATIFGMIRDDHSR